MDEKEIILEVYKTNKANETTLNNFVLAATLTVTTAWFADPASRGTESPDLVGTWVDFSKCWFGWSDPKVLRELAKAFFITTGFLGFNAYYYFRCKALRRVYESAAEELLHDEQLSASVKAVVRKDKRTTRTWRRMATWVPIAISMILLTAILLPL